MFRIGDFSKLSKVSVKTLRYYDEVGLFKPAEVDYFTGYRLYTASQLPRINRILALKDLGFSLEEISKLIDDNLTSGQMRGMLEMKRVELERQIQGEQTRLARVGARLRMIEQEVEMSDYEVVVKKVDAIKVASIRDIIPTYSEQGHLWKELLTHLEKHNVKPNGPCFTIYHDGEYKEKDVDAEVVEPIADDMPETGRIKVQELPGGTMTCVVHHGSYDKLIEAYNVLLKWIEENGYRIVGPDREIYLEGHFSTDDPNEYVTEVQFPVEKV